MSDSDDAKAERQKRRHERRTLIAKLNSQIEQWEEFESEYQNHEGEDPDDLPELIRGKDEGRAEAFGHAATALRDFKKRVEDAPFSYSMDDADTFYRDDAEGDEE